MGQSLLGLHPCWGVSDVERPLSSRSAPCSCCFPGGWVEGSGPAHLSTHILTLNLSHTCALESAKKKKENKQTQTLLDSRIELEESNIPETKLCRDLHLAGRCGPEVAPARSPLATVAQPRAPREMPFLWPWSSCLLLV